MYFFDADMNEILQMHQPKEVVIRPNYIKLVFTGIGMSDKLHEDIQDYINDCGNISIKEITDTKNDIIILQVN